MRPRPLALIAVVWAAAAAALSGQPQAPAADAAIAAPSLVWDERGYALYCFCMGRWGNQMDFFLTAMDWALRVGRVTVLPPIVDYNHPSGEYPYFHRFLDFFEEEPLHKALPGAVDAGAFLRQFKGRWEAQPGGVQGFCPTYGGEFSDDCMTQGVPREPFWKHLNVSFDKLHALPTRDPADVVRLAPAAEHPIFALNCIPGSYPVAEEHEHLHRHLRWNQRMLGRANAIANRLFVGQPFIGVHLRLGSDMAEVCEQVPDAGMDSGFFSSRQCPGQFTKPVCLPPASTVDAHLKQVVAANGIKRIFVATDSTKLPAEYEAVIKRYDPEFAIGAAEENAHDPIQMDLIMLHLSSHFIGQCASSFTHFVSRSRRQRGTPTSYWGHDHARMRLSFAGADGAGSRTNANNQTTRVLPLSCGAKDDRSPGLTWAGIPASAKALALIVQVDDHHAAATGNFEAASWVHWGVYNLEASSTGLERGALLPRMPAALAMNSAFMQQWGSACPPEPPVTEQPEVALVFKLYALKEPLNMASFGEHITAQMVRPAMEGYALDTAEIRTIMKLHEHVSKSGLR